VGWVVLQGQHTIQLNNLSDSDVKVILDRVPQHIAKEVSNDLSWCVDRQKKQVELIKDNRRKGTTSEDIIKFIKRFGGSGTDEFDTFCRRILNADNPLEFCKDLRRRKIHTGWLADMRV
jgi:hypothetical protein